MAHDPLHDWLDMAARTLGGDKKAYKHYKSKKEREKLLSRPKNKVNDNKGHWLGHGRDSFGQEGGSCSQGGPFNATRQSPSVHSGLRGALAGSQAASPSGSAALNTSTKRVSTSVYQIGNMNRTFIEAMVPEDLERGDR